MKPPKAPTRRLESARARPPIPQRRTTAFPYRKAGALGGKDSFDYTGLENDKVDYYAAFVDLGGKLLGRAFRRGPALRPGAGPVRWAYSTGAAALAPPGIGSRAAYALSNDRTVHGLVRGDTGGDWPASSRRRLREGWADPASARAHAPHRSRDGGPPGGRSGRTPRCRPRPERRTPVPAPPVLGERVQAAAAGLFAAFGGVFLYLPVGTRNSSSGSAFYALDVATGLPVGDRSKRRRGVRNRGHQWHGGRGLLGQPRVLRQPPPGRGSPNTLWALDISGSGLSLAWAIDLGDIDGSRSATTSAHVAPPPARPTR